jgi:hypothetical protein
VRIVLTCCGRHAVFKSYGLKPLSVGGDWKEDINFSINMATYNTKNLQDDTRTGVHDTVAIYF